MTASNVHFRRSKHADASSLAKLMQMHDLAQGGIPTTAVFSISTETDFSVMIETSACSVTACCAGPSGEEIVGFVSLSDGPQCRDKQPSSTAFVSAEVEEAAPCNSAWLNMAIAPPSSLFSPNTVGAVNFSSEELLRALLFHGLSSLSYVSHIFSTPGSPFPLLRSVGAAAVSVGEAAGHSEEMLHFSRGEVIPSLKLRLGRVEDYDDLVSLLVAGGPGVITDLSPDFLLEEVLQYQDVNHRVVVAEHSVTHEVIGMACLRRMAVEEQQQMARVYIGEPFDRFRKVSGTLECGDAHDTAETDGSNSFFLDFVYFHPEQQANAHQFVPFFFEQFPSCDYALVLLRHDLTPEPLLLKAFEYAPLRRHRPHNNMGEAVPVPQGLFVCSRYALGATTTVHADGTDETFHAVEEILDDAVSRLPGFQPAMATALRSGVEEVRAGKGDSRVLVMYWGAEKLPIGAAVVARLTVEDMYALRGNYSIDSFVNFYLQNGHDYGKSNISVSAAQERRRYFSTEMPGALLKAFCIRPAFALHTQTFLREALRLVGAEVLLTLANEGAAPPHAVLSRMTYVSPRRVVERDLVAQGGGGGDITENVGNDASLHPEDGPAQLACAFIATRRLLGDECMRIASRIVVVGSSDVGLSLIYSLLAVPYVHFLNIVLVSTDGLPLHPNQMKEQWSTDCINLLEREHMRFHLHGGSLRVVTGSLVDIEPQQKYIQVDNGSYEPYDYLVLVGGRQYVFPPDIKSLLQQNTESSRSGIIPMCGEAAVDRLLQTLTDLESGTGSSIANLLVYGSGLDAFAAVTSIVASGFPAQRLVLCRREADSPFTGAASSDAVAGLFRCLGVTVLNGYEVSRLEYDDESLSSVLLAPATVNGRRGEGDVVELPCAAVLCMEDKDMDAGILAALSRRSIVFDGRVIVGSNYETSNGCVLSAGPLAMFTRRHGGSAPNFDEVSSRDVGSDLSHVVLAKVGLDEFMSRNECGEEQNEALAQKATETLYSKVLQENGSVAAMRAVKQASGAGADEAAALKALERLPKYLSPTSQRLHLPRGYTYFASVCEGGLSEEKCVALECSSLDMSNLPFDEAEDADEGAEPQQLLSIYVNKSSRRVDAVVYLGNHSRPPLFNYRALVGLPESLFNLTFRYREAEEVLGGEGKVDIPMSSQHRLLTCGKRGGALDLIAYFRLPHLQVFLSDRFNRFFRRLREEMHDAAQEAQKEAGVPDCSAENRAAARSALTNHGTDFRSQIQLAILQFLHEEKDRRDRDMFLPSIKKQMSTKVI